jgi:hypothetical protein
MTPTEAARIVDRAIATKAAAVGCWPSRPAWCSLSRASGNVCEPEVGGYAAAITTVGIMTTPTIMIE